jgi:glycosyltransferase involved in cell wall biosynthesis
VKVLMAPANVAGQPIALVRELRRQGVDASLLVYGVGHPFGYGNDLTFDLRGRHRIEAQGEAVKRTIADGYDVYHLWRSPLLSGADYGGMYGMELPFLKARDKRILYSPTGFDVRVRSEHVARNPHNAFAYGYELQLDEALLQRFLAYLRDYVDCFTVLDPELGEFLPGAPVVPRAIDLDGWPAVGVEPSDRPLIVHAPSVPAVKGTALVTKALDELAQEGLRFELKLITGMAHAEAMEWYRRADLVVDQLFIGWYGVFTVEALALGKPVVVYVREDLYEAFTPRIPIANANPLTVKDVLRELIGSFDARRALAERARPFAEEVHDVRVVARTLRAVYEDVLARPPRRPETTADIDWFLEQCKRLETLDERLPLLSKARAFDAALAEFRQLRAVGRRYDELVEQLPELRRRASAPALAEGARRRRWRPRRR